jgi:hypothetical protein
MSTVTWRDELLPNDKAEAYMGLPAGELIKMRRKGLGPDCTGDKGVLKYARKDLDKWLRAVKKGTVRWVP